MAALDGMRVLDLTQYEAGPSATQALAWMGADVVKIERPGAGDPGRWGAADSPYFQAWNANKRSVALDLSSAEGRALVLAMAPRFDVFVENLGPGVIEKLRLGYDEVHAVHPTVIYGSVKGFGATGPYAAYKCFDGIAMAMSGAVSVTGQPDGPPVPPGPTMGDVGTGMQLALSICAAYIQRLRTGEGQRIELSMQEAMIYYLRTRISMGGAYGRHVSPRLGGGRGPANNVYPCSPFGPNDYVAIMAITETMWRDLVTTIGRSDLLDDPRAATPRDRLAHEDALKAVVAEWCAARTKHEAFQLLATAGVPCGAVLDTKELHDDPHLRARGYVCEVELPSGEVVPTFGWPARMSASSVPVRAAPLLGADTGAVLAAELGLDDGEVAGLRARGVIA